MTCEELYGRTVTARFIDRPNRFIAHAELDGRTETVHVKNTGRCRELLLPGREILLAEGTNPARKTRYDLVAVVKPNLGWVNIDSQAPNRVMGEWLRKGDFTLIRPESTFGNSRFDFYAERGAERWFIEVKGCTLEVDGTGYFPDAPTDRGRKHLRELVAAREAGYRTAVAFVIQMNGVLRVLPNEGTDPAFAEALRAAEAAGVEVWHLPCRVSDRELTIIAPPVPLLSFHTNL